MPIADRKEADEVLALVRAIAPSGRAGIELATLVSRVRITPKRVEKLMQKHADYFVRVGGQQKFTLNRFGKYDGSAERIIADVQETYERHKKTRITILVLFAMIGAIASTVAAVSSN